MIFSQEKIITNYILGKEEDKIAPASSQSSEKP